MICETFADLMDDYLQNEITAEQREAFEAHYFECDSCFLELKTRERLYSKEIPITLKGQKRLFIFKPKLAFIFSSLLIIIVFAWVFINHNSHTNLLYEISDFDPPHYMQTNTRSLSDQQTFNQAMLLYIKKDYSSALNILRKINKNDTNPQILFFKGICYLITDDLKNAIDSFNIIIKNMNPSYYDEAIYYKGIALLRKNKKDQALKQFNNLASMFSPYSARAKTLIEKINNI
jgi:tetratricopeptide (TPR) repeat protein